LPSEATSRVLPIPGKPGKVLEVCFSVKGLEKSLKFSHGKVPLKMF
jgi:hypothetical protein